MSGRDYDDTIDEKRIDEELAGNVYGSNGNDSNGNGNVELELTPELKQSGIVTSFIFQKKINSIIVNLNHVYNKKIIISPINNSDWSKAVGNFEKKLKNKGVGDKDHILQLSEVLDNNYEKLKKKALMTIRKKNYPLVEAKNIQIMIHPLLKTGMIN